MGVIAVLFAIVALCWCAYLHYYLYRALILCNRDARALNRLLKVINASGILKGKFITDESLEPEEPDR